MAGGHLQSTSRDVREAGTLFSPYRPLALPSLSHFYLSLPSSLLSLSSLCGASLSITVPFSISLCVLCLSASLSPFTIAFFRNAYFFMGYFILLFSLFLFKAYFTIVKIFTNFNIFHCLIVDEITYSTNRFRNFFLATFRWKISTLNFGRIN